jgi:spoIIIJ-associated protein
MTPTDNPQESVRRLVERIVEAFGIDAEVAVSERGEQLLVEVSGDDLDAFIGRDGTVIDAVQHLAYKVASAGGARGPRVVVDAGGYRDRRREALERAADQAAERALESGGEVALEPMSAIERKVVHEYLRERGDVETWSEGTEPSRHLVVAPLES